MTKRGDGWTDDKRRQAGDQLRRNRWRGGHSLHPLFNTWRGLLKYAKLAGLDICEEWRDDVWLFYNYVEAELGPRPEGSPGFWWISEDAPLGPNNTAWVVDHEWEECLCPLAVRIECRCSRGGWAATWLL